MKTTCLLISATLVATFATAQQRTGILFNDAQTRAAAPKTMGISMQSPTSRCSNASNPLARTTAATSRWYNYGDYLNVASSVNFSALYLWNDTTSVDAYAASTGSGTQYQFNDMVSAGLIIDPFFEGWGDVGYFPGAMQLTPADAYIIDSVFISGVYYRNNDKPVPVDTLTLTIFYGDGSAASDLHFKGIDSTGGRSWIYDEYAVDSLFYTNMHYDSVSNHADTFNGGVAPVIKKLFLTNTDTSGAFQAVVPVSISVPAGHRPAMSLSFKSGDALFTFGDTVFMSDGLNVKYKYGMFRPLISYEGIGGNAVFPTNAKDNLNEGVFRDQGENRAAGNLYRPMWFWYNASTNGASDLQYPYFAFHLSCPTCFTVGSENTVKKTTSVNLYPNPANNEVILSCNDAKDAAVTITDMTGRTIATQHMEQGRAVINTTALPGGIYIYTLNSGDVHTVGRFVVAH